MDQRFINLLGQRRGAMPVALDYAQLTAGLAAQQAASATGVAATLDAAPVREATPPPCALTILFAAAPGWATAVAALGGRFHPGMRAGASSTSWQRP